MRHCIRDFSKNGFLGVFLVMLLVIFLGCSKAQNDLASELSAISITEAWIAEPPPGSSVLAGYLEIENQSDIQYTLTAVRSKVFGRAEIHSMLMDDGVMKMMQLDSLVVAARSSLLLEPGGNHLMLFDPSVAITQGDQVPVSLVFESDNAEVIEVNVAILVKRR